MFWKRPHEQTSHPAPDELRAELSAYLRDRLHLALEFATLGAYEDDGGEPVDREERPGGSRSGGSRESKIELGRTCAGTARGKRRSAAQPHAQAFAVPCERAAVAEASCSAAATVTVRAPAQRRIDVLSGRRQRQGQITAPKQPCIWNQS